MEIDKQKITYERMMSDLLMWINGKIKQLNARSYPNSLEGIQKELSTFKKYRTVEKPPRYTERAEIEAQLFAIQTKLKALGEIFKPTAVGPTLVVYARFYITVSII